MLLDAIGPTVFSPPPIPVPECSSSRGDLTPRPPSGLDTRRPLSPCVNAIAVSFLAFALSLFDSTRYERLPAFLPNFFDAQGPLRVVIFLSGPQFGHGALMVRDRPNGSLCDLGG